jgi:hypothetical protein
MIEISLGIDLPDRVLDDSRLRELCDQNTLRPSPRRTRRIAARELVSNPERWIALSSADPCRRELGIEVGVSGAGDAHCSVFGDTTHSLGHPGTGVEVKAAIGPDGCASPRWMIRPCGGRVVGHLRNGLRMLRRRDWSS